MAGHYRGHGREFLRRLERGMDFQGLQQAESTHEIVDQDGNLEAVIHVHSIFGQNVITIYCPPLIEEEEPEREEEVAVRSRKARFFIKLLRYKEHDEDEEKDVVEQYMEDMFGQQYEYDYYWVEFDKKTDEVLVYSVNHDGEFKAQPFPKDFEKVGTRIQVGRLIINYNNYGGKSFERHGQRLVAYTGVVGLLYQGHSLVKEIGPDIENNTGVDTRNQTLDIYFPNYHKFHILNADDHGLYIAWYYYRQYPFWYNTHAGEHDRRFSKIEIYVGKVLGQTPENMMVGFNPKMTVIGGSSHSGRDGLTSLIEDGSDAGWINGRIGGTTFAGMFNSHKQFPQSAHSKLDLISCSGFGQDLRVTAFQNHHNTLVKATYRFRTEEEWEEIKDNVFMIPITRGRWVGIITDEGADTIAESKSLVWSKQGSSQADGITYKMVAESHKKFQILNYKKNWRDNTRFANFRDMIGCGVDTCSATDTIITNYPTGWFRISTHFSFMWGTSWSPTEGRKRAIDREIKLLPGPFSNEYELKGLARRIRKEGEVGNAHYYERHQRNALASSWQHGTPSRPNATMPCVGHRGTARMGCARTRFYHYDVGYVYGNTSRCFDDYNFGFEWFEMYNDKYTTGCEILHPNHLHIKSRFVESRDNSRGAYFFHHTPGSVSSQKRVRRPAGSANWSIGGTLHLDRHMYDNTSPIGVFPNICELESIMLMQSDFSASLPSANERWERHVRLSVWGEVLGYFDRGQEASKSSSRTSYYFIDEKKTLMTDGVSPITSASDYQHENFFMDDRSTEDSQGVFMLEKEGAEIKFYHFWDSASSLRNVTDEIFKQLGLTTSQDKARVHCIGLV